MPSAPLSYDDVSPILFRRWLGIGLSDLRQQAGMNQRDAAERLDVNRAAIGHYENGRNLPSVGDLRELLMFYGAEHELDRLRAYREGARRGKNWWAHIAQAGGWFDHYLGLESGVIGLGSFDLMYVTGLLQTEDFAKAMIRTDHSLSDERVAELAAVRTRRRHILERPDHPAKLRAVIDESVLYRSPRPSEPEILSGQLRSLLADLDHPQIELRVLPLAAPPVNDVVDYPFKLLSFPEQMVGDHGVAYVELLGGAHYYEEPGEIEIYEQALEDLISAAADLKDSRRLIEHALKETS